MLVHRAHTKAKNALNYTIPLSSSQVYAWTNIILNNNKCECILVSQSHQRWRLKSTFLDLDNVLVKWLKTNIQQPKKRKSCLDKMHK